MRLSPWLAMAPCLATAAEAAELISVNAAGTDSGNAASLVPSEEIQPFGDGGNRIVFSSNATDLVATADGNGTTDVFLRDRAAGSTALISLNATGDASGNDFSGAASISEDGRYVVFVSDASDLTATADGNADTDLFIRDLQSGVTRLISRATSGTRSANAGTYEYTMTPDAAWIAFQSDASDLVDTDGNGTTDVFLYSRAADSVTLVSRNQAGSDAGDAQSTVEPRSAISADGRYLVYQSSASDLVGGDANGNRDVFLYDALNDINRRISRVPGGAAGGNGDSDNAIISADGGRVVFRSAATDLTADNDANGVRDLFAWEAASDSIELVTINAAGTASGSGGAVVTDPRISDDGRYLVFEAQMTDLTAIADGNGTDDLFLRDLVDDTTTLVTANADGDATANGQPDDPQISADGRFVYYETLATDVVSTADINGRKDSYVWDRSTGVNYLLSINGAGSATGNDFSYDPQQSRDGRFVALDSGASDLVAGGTDSNAATDVYVVELTDIIPGLADDAGEVDDDSSSTAWSPLGLLLLGPALLTAGFRRRPPGKRQARR